MVSSAVGSQTVETRLSCNSFVLRMIIISTHENLHAFIFAILDSDALVFLNITKIKIG